MRRYSFGLLVLAFIFSISVSCGEKGKEDTAENHPISLDSLLSAYPDSVPLLIKKGEDLVGIYNYDLAMNFAAKAFRLDSNNIKARELYASVLNNRAERTVGDVALAQRHFKYILKKEPKNTKALVGLASTYTQQSDFDQSFKYINEALRIDKKYRDAYVLKGTNYRLMGKPDLMKSSYETAIQQDPEFFEGYFLLGDIYRSEGDKVCIEYFTTAHELRPDAKLVEYYLAFSKQHFGQLDGAKEMYRVMAKDTSEEMSCGITANCVQYSSLANFQLGHIKQYVDKDIDSAIIFYSRAINGSPDYAEAHHNMGICYDVQGNKSLALKKLGEALKFAPEHTLSKQIADSIRKQL